MSARMKLGPGEGVLINGAMVRNGDRRNRVTVENAVQILREKDILLKDNATTPCRRLYLVVQNMYLDLAHPGRYRDEFVQRVCELRWVFENNPSVQAKLDTVVENVDQAEFYSALSALRDVIHHEDTINAYARLPEPHTGDTTNGS